MCATTYFGDKLVEAVRAGQVDESCIDEAAVRIVRTLLAFQAAREQAPEQPGETPPLWRWRLPARALPC